MILDVMALIPINVLFEESANNNYTSLIRVARFPRLFRLIKITKFVRMYNDMNTKRKKLVNVNDNLKISSGVERLIWFLFIFILTVHLIACFWIMLAKM
jgi:hypothetical protein